MTNPAEGLMQKLKAFSESLPPAEKALFAALIAPAVARVHDDPEVETFGVTHWMPNRLPEALEEAIRDRDIRVEGL